MTGKASTEGERMGAKKRGYHRGLISNYFYASVIYFEVLPKLSALMDSQRDTRRARPR